MSTAGREEGKQEKRTQFETGHARSDEETPPFGPNGSGQFDRIVMYERVAKKPYSPARDRNYRRYRTK